MRPRPVASAGATALVAAVAAVVGAMIVGLGPGRATPATGSVTASRAAAPTTSTTSTTVATTTSPPTTTTVDPGTLPQTADRPTVTSARFVAGVAALWDAIVTDQPEKAYPFFFPKAAYLQVKAIADPAGDYDRRLIANLAADVHADHAALGAAAVTAHLDGVDVPDGQAVWVQPGAEYNKGSYWRVYGTTLRWSAPGASGTLPIASLISWRGEWYLVHLASIR